MSVVRRPQAPTRWVPVLAVLCLLAPWAAPALAHKVNLFAFAEGGQVYVQGYFSDGKRPKGGKVEVFGPGGELLLEGRTNEDGEFTFPSPEVSPLEVVLDAELGHVARLKLDLAGEDGDGGGADQAAIDGGDDAGAVDPAPGAAAGVSGRQLESLIHRAVAKAVLPLAREVDALKSRVSTDRLLAGVGVILALLGGVAYLQARRLRDEAERLRAEASNKNS